MSTARIRQQVTHPRGRGGGLASAGLRRQPRLPERPGLAGGTAAELGRGMGPAPSRPSVPPFSVAFRAEGATRHWPPPSSRDPTPDAGIRRCRRGRAQVRGPCPGRARPLPAASPPPSPAAALISPGRRGCSRAAGPLGCWGARWKRGPSSAGSC